MSMQDIIDQAVKLATNAAMNNTPVSSIQWIAPTSATERHIGRFIVTYYKERSASDRPPWT